MSSLSFTCASLKLLTVAFAATWLAACSGKSGISPTASYNPGYGPFDQNGNYVEAWADKPARKHTWETKPASSEPVGRPMPRKNSPVVVSRNKPTKPPALLASQTPPSRPEPPQSRPAPSQPAPKPTIRHTVAKGDTLYSLGRRYGTSVGAIQRANGISGTIIRIGQKLKIPR